MSEAVFGLIGVVVGGFMTAIAEALRLRASFKREKKWTAIQERRRQLERVYEAAESHRIIYHLLGLKIITAVADIPVGDDTIPKAPDDPPIARLKMLVQLYAPQLREALGALERETLEFTNAFLKLNQVERESRREVLGREIIPGMKRMNDAHDQFATHVASVAERLVDEERELA